MVALITIKLDEKDFSKIASIVSKRKSKLIGKTYTKFDSKDDALIGVVGEVAIEKYLKLCGFVEGNDFETNYNCPDDYDKWDVLVKGKEIDVKTEKSLYTPNSEWYYGFPVIQKPNNKDLIVICIFNPTKKEVYVIGAIEGKEVSKCPKTLVNGSGKFKYKIENYDIPSKLLKSLKSFFE